MGTESDGFAFFPKENVPPFFFKISILLIISFSRTSVIDFANFSFSLGKEDTYTFFFNFAKYINRDEMERNLFSQKPGCFIFHECLQGKWIFFIVEKNVSFSLALACCPFMTPSHFS